MALSKKPPRPDSLPKRKRRLPPSRRTFAVAAVLISVFFAITIFLLMTGIFTTLLAPESNDRKAASVLVNIPPGASTREIGDLLVQKHLIRKAMGFVLAAKMDGLSGQMKAGRYELSPAMPPRQIALLITLGQTATDIVTIPEGFTVKQIAARLAENHMADQAKFLTLAQSQGQTFNISGFRPTNANLEGYLFPDTYRIAKGATERDIITQMLGDFQKRVLVPNHADFAHYPGGVAAAVNLASLIEREAEVPGDRTLISAALTNRLHRKMRLECDATIEYALPEHKSRLFYRDLKVDSPYNTYLHAGLPPTPIANPGLPSILAALHPAKADYLYYVAGPGGKHVFSRTLAQHEQNVMRMRALRAHA